MKLKMIAVIACALGFLVVALGAFGAHGLKSKIAAEMLVIFETGVRYQMYHVFALLFIVCLAQQVSGINLQLPAWLFIAGITIFSGSLYILALSGVRTWGAVTPVGGVLLLIGWFSLFWKILKT